jgi:hypothetical protein
VPPSYDGARRTPLVSTCRFGSNARQQAIYSGLPAKGDREGSSSSRQTAPARRSAGISASAASTPSRSSALLDHLDAQLCIDQQRVFAAGISNGSGLRSGWPAPCPTMLPSRDSGWSSRLDAAPSAPSASSRFRAPTIRACRTAAARRNAA